MVELAVFLGFLEDLVLLVYLDDLVSLVFQLYLVDLVSNMSRMNLRRLNHQQILLNRNQIDERYDFR